MYWSGLPRERALHIDLRELRHPWNGLVLNVSIFDFDWAIETARLLSQHNSFLARSRERHSCRSNGRRGSCRYASRIVLLGIRGIAPSGPNQYGAARTL